MTRSRIFDWSRSVGRASRRAACGARQAFGLLAVLLIPSTVLGQSPDETFRAMVGELRDAGYAEKEAIAERLLDTGHAAAQAVLTALLEDRLYATEADQRVFIVTNPADDATNVTAVQDPVTLASAGMLPRDQLAKIGTNNRLRRTLRIAIARFALSSTDPSARLAAVRDMNRSLDEATIELLQQRFGVEPDRRVRREIETGLALAALEDADPAARRTAVQVLSDRLSQEVRNRLAAKLEQTPDGGFAEADTSVRTAAADAVAVIDRSRSWYSGIETLFFGLSLGSVLVLVAIGLAITFGVMGVINMAHGELMMLGAYTVYVVQLALPRYIEASVLIALPAAFVVAGGAGVLLERTVIRFLYGRPLETLLATFGVSLILQQLVRSVFSANNRAVETPAWMSGTLVVNEALSLTYNRLYIVAFTLILFTALLTVLKRTHLGLNIRAVAQNRSMARAMGVRTEWVDALTFGLGAGIAGVAGVALSQLTNVGPNLGQSYIIDSFMVVVFGGVGNLWGTLIGGMTMGVVDKLLEPYAGAVLSKIAVLIALILFIQRRPRGLFPQTGRAAESA